MQRVIFIPANLYFSTQDHKVTSESESDYWVRVSENKFTVVESSAATKLDMN